MIYVNFKKLTPTAIVPTKGSAGAAGFDLYADTNINMYINPGETRMIKTGICMEIPDGYFGAIYARSSLGVHKGLRPPNCVGIIDSDYRGNIAVPLFNDSPTLQMVQAHERVAQLIIQAVPEVKLYEREILSDTERGSGGFGSTGRT